MPEDLSFTLPYTRLYTIFGGGPTMDNLHDANKFCNEEAVIPGVTSAWMVIYPKDGDHELRRSLEVRVEGLHCYGKETLRRFVFGKIIKPANGKWDFKNERYFFADYRYQRGELMTGPESFLVSPIKVLLELERIRAEGGLDGTRRPS